VRIYSDLSQHNYVYAPSAEMIPLVKPQETELIPEYGYVGTENLIIYLRELWISPSTMVSNGQTHAMPASLTCRFANIEG